MDGQYIPDDINNVVSLFSLPINKSNILEYIFNSDSIRNQIFDIRWFVIVTLQKMEANRKKILLDDYLKRFKIDFSPKIDFFLDSPNLYPIIVDDIRFYVSLEKDYSIYSQIRLGYIELNDIVQKLYEAVKVYNLQGE